MKKTIIAFSLLIIALLALFQLSKYTIFIGKTSVELITTIVATVFLIVGIYINKKTLHKEKSTTQKVDHSKIEELQISKREYEVLRKISDGLSNKEITEMLFVSESTIKSHVSSLLLKLNAKRRTQAVQKAKEMHIID
ncbi:MAG: helix-turn-helix transcriptional regulator [Bacteroidetes bacterium MedPE-SWsnd-G1]|nr:MAG: helix-turn-helix transcriptional regulator [Bacteroidetes bacterium MedPE-SWsnd-G1]